MKRIAIGLAAALALVMSGCSITGDNLTDPSFQTARYAGGVGEGSKFKECVEGGEKMVGDDTYYPYPATQREAVWDSDKFVDRDGDGFGDGSADYPDLEVTDADGRRVYVKMKVQFFLNTDCTPVTVGDTRYEGGTLQAFHEKIGKTRKAYFNESGEYGSGWLWAMNNYISTPVVNFVSRASRVEKAEEMYKDAAIQDAMQTDLAAALPGLVNDGMETDLQFYERFGVQIFKITPDDEYLNLLRDRENAQIKAETAQANSEARVAEAKANAEVAEAEARVRQAEIRGYGGIEGYLKNKAIDKGINPWQPTTSGLITGN